MSVAQLSRQRACRSLCRHASEVCPLNHPIASRVRQVEIHQVSQLSRMCHTLHGAGWMEGFAGGLRSAIARDAGLPTKFKSEVSTSHQVCIGGQTPGSPMKLFCLIPFLLLHRPFGGHRVSCEDLCEWFDKFTRGEWHSLLEEALVEDNRGISKARTSTLEARARAACQNVQLGEVLSSPSMFGWRQHRARHRGKFPGDAGQAPSRSGAGYSSKSARIPA